MVDMSIHDVSGVVGWCLGAYSEVENTYVHRLHTFLHTGSGLYNPLQQPRIVSRPHILYNISTTLYNSLQSTALQQFYSLQPLHHPSAPGLCPADPPSYALGATTFTFSTFFLTSSYFLGRPSFLCMSHARIRGKYECPPCMSQYPSKRRDSAQSSSLTPIAWIFCTN